MASISSAGIGSGLNVESLVTGLMAVEQQPLTRLQTQQSSYQSKISALGTLKSALSSLQAAAKAMTPAIGQSATTALKSYAASFSDSTVASATISGSAVAGNYSLEVKSLIANQSQAFVNSYGAGDTVVATPGTLTFTTGSGASAKTTSLTLDSSQTSLSAVRDAINGANAGVSASIVTDSQGKQNLLMTATTAGTPGAVTIGGTAEFADPNNVGSTIAANAAFKVTQAATDATVMFQGVEITSTTGNTINNAIDGVTLNLTKTGTTTLTVTQDNSSLKSKLDSFISAYNSLNSSIKSLGAYNATTKTGSVLTGDASLRSIQTQVRSAITSIPAGLASNSIKNLSEMGVSFQADGSLSVDSTKFSAAVDKNFDAVATAISGYSSAVQTATTNLLSSRGVISSRTDGLNASINSISKQIDTLNTRLTAIEKRYRSQFTALDSTIASMNSTSSFLTQQLKSLSA